MNVSTASVPPEPVPPDVPTHRFRSKLVATALAALLGTFGAHRFYLQGARRPTGWLYLLFCWTLVPTFAGLVEALRFALTPDDQWDARWNAGTGRRSASGWPVVLLAVLTFFGGALLLMTLIAFVIGRVVGSGESFF